MNTTRRLFSLLLAAAFVAAAGAAEAKNFTVGDPPVAVVSLPDGWNPREYDGGVEANAPDDGVYIAVEAVKIKDVETATRQGIAHFQRNGVTIDASTMKKKEITIGGLPAVDVTWDGKDSDGATHVSLTFVVLSDTQSVLLYLWGSDDDMKAAGPELQKVADSLKPIAR